METGKTRRLYDLQAGSCKTAIQIFGSDKEAMGYAANEVSKVADIVDINMGCPAPKVVKNGDGSKLMLNLELASSIIEEVVKNSKVPVTLKMRKGWDKEHITAIELAKIAEEKGVSAITIHGRTKEEYYSGEADWEFIKKVKQSVSIPVIGNGDIKTPEQAKQMLSKTNVDGIMIGRSAIGNPWLFREIKEYLQGNEITNVTLEEKFEVIFKHLNLQVEYLGERVGIKEFRKYLHYYLKNLPHVANVKQQINQIETKQELISCLQSYFTSIK